jgi:AraC family transcriptional regulator
MEPRIETSALKKLVGKRIRMSYSDNKTFELWKSFMPRRKEITNNKTTDLFSMQIFDKNYDFKDLDQEATFEKWAAIEVTDFNTIPDGMEYYTLTGGLYAVFIHKGAAGTAPKTFNYIFGTWLPNSEYLLDIRPHFEILGQKYIHEDPDSEEEVWIPVKPKKSQV